MNPVRPTRTAVAVGLPVLLVLAACSAGAEQRPDPTTSSAADALERFHDQSLEFGSCEEFAVTELDEQAFPAFETAECAYLQVPVDYDSPEDETAQIAVLRLPAQGERIGPLLVNPGGPGGPGLIQALNTAVGLEGTAIPERFDIVAFDPRGVGASVPAVDCVSDAEADAGLNVFPQAATQGSWTADDIEELTAACVEGTGSKAVLANLGTRDVARDMDLLRSALGEEQISFLGQSYGARLGPVYAEMFPQGVRALVMDSGPDPTLGTVARRLTQYAGFQAAFDQMATACAAEEDCVLGDDPAAATARFQEIVRPLLEAPVPTTEGRELDYNGAVNGVVSGLYDAGQWPTVLEGIAEISQGSGTVLQALSDAFGGRASDGRWSNYPEANSAINCMDEERRTPEQEEELRTDIYDVAPFMDPGEGPDGARDGCEAWPAEPDLGYPYATDVEGLPDTLTIALTDDPSTPYEGGVALAEAMGSTLLTVQGAQHTVAMTGVSECVNDVLTAYLVDLRVPDSDTTCEL